MRKDEVPTATEQSLKMANLANHTARKAGDPAPLPLPAHTTVINTFNDGLVTYLLKASGSSCRTRSVIRATARIWEVFR